MAPPRESEAATRTLAAGIGFTEGPLWTADGRLLVASVSRGLVYTVALDGAAPDVIAEPGGGPNGLAVTADGSVWIAQNGGSVTPSRSERPATAGLQRLQAETGVVADVLTAGTQAPNDLVQGPDGRLWFTDPGRHPTSELGCVRAYDPSSGELTTLVDGLRFPNGLVLGPEPGDLLVAETIAARIERFTWDGLRLVSRGTFARLDAGMPDGMALDVEGRLFVAATTADEVAVFDRAGRALEPIAFGGPTFPTNLAFAGDDLDVLVVTAAKGGRVLAVEGVGRGLPLTSSLETTR
jgi:gluconolactonase